MDNSGAIWVKSGADKRKVTSREELRRLFQSSDLVHSDEIPVNGSSINDIDKDYFKEYYLKEFDENLNDVNLPLIQVFNNLNLAKDNLLNLAGLLLFGENPQRLKPTFVIKAISFLGNEVTGNKYRDSEDMGGKLTNQYKNGISFLKRNLKKLQGDKGVNSLGDLEVPEVVLEELLVNALIHRNYFISAPIRLFIFDNRLEMISPGVLPNKLTIENIKNGNSIIRNPILTSFGTKELPYRGIGTGIRRALKNYKEIDLVNDTQNELFKVIIKRPTVL